ncbi:MAG: hypothetical protein DRN83_02040 [Hadesarchaea archaeon]|nr:MAG: hypothetical protein DRN83_02040 [Hadesarchaea archaeon]HDI12780.1 hypothetical protein [Hadesarchaea archaeon]
MAKLSEYLSALDWIVQKTAELLEDKVKDAPLTEEDIKIAFGAFAKTRLDRLAEDSFKSEHDRTQAEDFIMAKLRERAKQLNAENWGKGGRI